MTRAVLCVAALLCRSAAEELRGLPELKASDGPHTLHFEDVPFGFGLGYPFRTRGYNGSIPGPTFRVRPGEILEVRVVNRLGAYNPSCDDVQGAAKTDYDRRFNQFCDANTTNFHTHGLHISPVSNGSTYSDDIFAEVKPGESGDFRFVVPAFHMGGTHWYHPHHHHSTGLQAGGGAAGALIVEDPEGYLPDEYDAMPEKVIVLTGFNLEHMQEMAEIAMSPLGSTAFSDAQAAGLPAYGVLANGQYEPTISIDAYAWYRWRLVFSSIEAQLILVLESEDADCDLKLLAKDGVYLPTLPRDIGPIFLHPGARSDVAISCVCRESRGACSASFTSCGATKKAFNIQPFECLNQTVLHLSIRSDSVQGEVTGLESTEVARPCYLVDLRNVTVEESNIGTIFLDRSPNRERPQMESASSPNGVLTWSSAVEGQGLNQSMTHQAVHHAGGKDNWPSLTRNASMRTGQVYEWNVINIGQHPFHIHVNPYQIVGPNESYDNGYFMAGDWHDIVLIDEMVGYGAFYNSSDGEGEEFLVENPDSYLTLRLQTDTFTGKMVAHCHFLRHEDQGMMGFFNISGDEGAIYEEAEEIDPQCYRRHFERSASAYKKGGRIAWRRASLRPSDYGEHGPPSRDFLARTPAPSRR